MCWVWGCCVCLYCGFNSVVYFVLWFVLFSCWLPDFVIYLFLTLWLACCGCLRVVVCCRVVIVVYVGRVVVFCYVAFCWAIVYYL